jgi:dUTP pyrophosphatase
LRWQIPIFETDLIMTKTKRTSVRNPTLQLSAGWDQGHVDAVTTVKVAKLPHARGLALPAYQTAGAAGLDLEAAVPAKKPVRLEPMGRALIPTGLILEIPAGFEAQVRPRSGLALKHGVTVLNSPGTIDSDYRGEVQVLLINLGTVAFEIKRGERIAQLVVAEVSRATLAAGKPMAATKRGRGGFGSTGVVKAAKSGAKPQSVAKVEGAGLKRTARTAAKKGQKLRGAQKSRKVIARRGR